MLCYYWYFLDKNFSYGPYHCDGCYNITQKSMDLKSLMTNSNLIDKKDVL